MIHRILFFLGIASVLSARPVPMPTIAELTANADVVVILQPQSTRETSDKPDDKSFGERDLKTYQPLETTCKILSVFKGEIKADPIKIVHFAYAERFPEFNGGFFMIFLFDPTQVIVFPGTKNQPPDASQVTPYAIGAPEYLAFLRKLPDGRYAAACPQYDAALAFRVMATPSGSQQYHDPEAARDKKPASK